MTTGEFASCLTDLFLVSTAYEEMLEGKRKAIRLALKSEYMKKINEPFTGSKTHIFDASLYRWNALQFTFGEYSYMTWRTFFVNGLGTFVPLGLLCYYTYKGKVGCLS